MGHNIEFEVLGIAEVLKRIKLRVPPNQREYSWESEVVRQFLQDIYNAMRSRDDQNDYFLGTIVLTNPQQGTLEVADGQQRLATTTMILSHFRDHFKRNNETESAESIQNDYLFKYDIKEKDILPQLTLNLDDNEFFRDYVLQVSNGRRKDLTPKGRSHRLIKSAVQEISDYFNGLHDQFGSHFSSENVIEWVDYLSSKATVVKLTVSDSANAFIMFETLNDRGLKVSQADLVKNHLFKNSGNRIEEGQQHWSRMKGAIETLGPDYDLIMDFLRLTCCLLGGATREREIMKRLGNESQTKSESIKLLCFLEELSMDYAAILNPDHPKWNEYDGVVRKSIKTINNDLRVTQIRPLMLAISKHFNPKQTAISFKRLVSWSVRILISGIRGGRLDEAYSRLANEIHIGNIKSDDDLLSMSGDFIPTDAQFEKDFQNARVSVNRLARYYLRALERTASNQSEPEFIPNEDSVINLEHVMSRIPGDSVTEQDIETHFTRIGNLALLQASKNSGIGSLPFSEKREVFKESSYLLTSQIADLNNWGTEGIENRQNVLAALAIDTWPID